MATEQSVKAKILSLIDKANETTGNNDGNLTSAVNTLAEGFGNGGGIIDVAELPTENINESAIYRVPYGALYFNSGIQGTTLFVSELPAIGEPCTTDGESIGTVYYCIADNTLYGYVPAAIGSVLGVPANWYPAATLMGALGYTYGGVVASSSDMIDSSTFYFLLEYSYRACKDGAWVELSNSTGGLYVLELSGDIGTLTAEQYNALVANAPNVVIKYKHADDQYIFYTFWAEQSAGFLFQYFQKTAGSDESGRYDVLATNGIVIMKGYGGWTRMTEQVKIASKDYVDNAVANAGGGVKSITFTDRPTAWEWLKNNYSKLLKVVFSSAAMPAPITLTTFLYQHNDGVLTNIKMQMLMLNCWADSTRIECMDIVVSDTATKYLLRNATIVDGQPVSVGGDPEQEIPDEYWSAMAVQVTCYYIE